MVPWIIWLIAISSTSICIYLWFKDVLRIMREQKSIVDSAAKQFTLCREKFRKTREDLADAAVLDRSEKIYHQAITHYNQTLYKPWNYLPGRLLGFQLIKHDLVN